MKSTSCPGRPELFEFCKGNLPRSVFVRLAAHVERCPGCQSALETFDSWVDPLIARLRPPANAQKPCVDGVPEALLAAARAACSQRGSPASAVPGGARRLDRFELIQELGIGSFGHVFKAHDPELDRPVAIKVLRGGCLA